MRILKGVFYEFKIGRRPNALKRDNNTDRANERYHNFKQRESLVKKKVKTENGHGNYTYIDVDKNGKPSQVEQHNANGERQFTRSLNIKW